MNPLPTSDETIVTRGSGPQLGFGEPSGKACLVKIHPAAAGEGLIELPPRRYVIGREGECDLALADASVSRQHASVQPHVGNYLLVDLGSTNGTFVNDERIERKLLAPGDLVRVGTPVLKFLWSDHVEAQYHETLYAMMTTDGLTGVHNRRYFHETFERELARSQRHRRPLALAMLDVDHFKQINDTYGHLAGDEVLRELCARLRRTIRRDEVFARYGGEEFVVLMPECTLEQAGGFAERLRCLVHDEAVRYGDLEIPVTISLGIAHTAGEPAVTPQALIAQADHQLYQAKAAGRDQVCGAA